jgi:rod shape determining protein RodA
MPLLAGALLWLLGIRILAPYQHDRLLAFLDPERYARGPGYQLLQSRIAVGSGGLWGKGLGQGTQGQLGFLPARGTDFIFASIAEEWGFIGATVVLALYAYFVIASATIARRTRDPFGRLLVVGVMTLVASQALVNTAMTLRLAPVTGLPLPFVSLGGSSLVANFIALGILLNVGARPTTVLSREDFQ